MDFGLAEFERRLPEAEEVRAHAVDVLEIGVRAEALMDSIGHTWLLLAQPGVYSVPGSDTVFTALEPSRTATSDLVNATIQLDAVMRAYAESIEYLRIRYETVKVRVADFAAEFPESEIDEWNNDESTVRTRNGLAREVSELLSDLDEVQRDAANRITHITGSDRSYTEYDDIMRDGLIPFGYHSSEYFERSGGRMHRDLPWWHDTWDTVVGVPKAAGETLSEFGVLFGTKGGNEARLAWSQMYRTGETLYFAGPGRLHSDDERTAAAMKELELLGQDLIRMDQWEGEHPGYALGGNIFDVGTLFIGGGLVKAGVKAGSRRTRGDASSSPGTDDPPHTTNHPGTGNQPASQPPTWKDRAHANLDNLGRLLPGNRGQVPAPVGGRLPTTPDAPDTASDGFWFRGGKPRTEFAPEYSPSGRDPTVQPILGDPDGGNGFFRDVWRSRSGAPEQQYITGIDRVENTYAREYALGKPDGTLVDFDGHAWRDGKEVFTEVKGHYEFFTKFGPPNMLDLKLRGLMAELRSQKDALEHSADPGYVHEWVFTEKVVADAFSKLLAKDPRLAKGVVVRFESMP